MLHKSLVHWPLHRTHMPALEALCIGVFIVPSMARRVLC